MWYNPLHFKTILEYVKNILISLNPILLYPPLVFCRLLVNEIKDRKVDDREIRKITCLVAICCVVSIYFPNFYQTAKTLNYCTKLQIFSSFFKKNAI